MAKFNLAAQPGRSAFLTELLQDPQYQMAMRAYQQGSQTTPVQSGGEGLARALQGVAGGYFAGQAQGRMRDREKAYSQTLADALAAGQPWRNPDTDPEAVAGAVLPAPNDGPPVPARRYLTPGEVAPGTGGLLAMARVLAGNPDTATLGVQLQIKDIENKQKLQSQYALEGFKHGLGMTKTVEQRAYERSPEYLAFLARKAGASREPLGDRMALAQAGRPQTNIEVTGEQKGLEAAWKNTADMWKSAQEAAFNAQKNELVYRRMEQSMQKFRPGVTADYRLGMQAIARDVFGLKVDGVGEGELFQAVGKRLELLATPRGQGQITENERTIIRGTIPNISKTPEGVVAILGALRELDKFDMAYARIFTESARRNQGSPNPVEVAEGLEKLGSPPMPAFAMRLGGTSGLTPEEEAEYNTLLQRLRR